jgi:hypothetical protein
MTIGNIYQIISVKTGKCYIGSTSLDLKTRINRHKTAFKRYIKNKSGPYCSSYIVLSSKHKIILLESIDYKDKLDLKIKEDEYIKAFIGMCVNLRNAHFDYTKWYSTNKKRIMKYYVDNSDQKRKYQLARYYIKNELKYYLI